MDSVAIGELLMSKGRHAMQDPAGFWLAGLWVLLNIVELALLGAVVHESGPQLAASPRPLPASVPDTAPPDI